MGEEEGKIDTLKAELADLLAAEGTHEADIKAELDNAENVLADLAASGRVNSTRAQNARETIEVLTKAQQLQQQIATAARLGGSEVRATRDAEAVNPNFAQNQASSDI